MKTKWGNGKNSFLYSGDVLIKFECVKWAVRAHKGCAGDVFFYYV